MKRNFSDNFNHVLISRLLLQNPRHCSDWPIQSTCQIDPEPMLFKGFRHRRFGRKPKLICLYCYKIFITCVIHEPTQCTTLMISVCRLHDKSKTTGQLIYISSAQFNHLSAYYPFEPSLFAFYCIILDIPMSHHYIVDKSYWLRYLMVEYMLQDGEMSLLYMETLLSH